MRIRSFGMLVVFLLFLLFVAVNWGAVMTPLPVSLIITSFNAPLGLFLIIAGGALFFVMLLWMVWRQAVSLVDLQKANKEARAARALADQAEASRFASLEKSLDGRFAAFEKSVVDSIKTTLEEERQAAAAERKALADTLETMSKSYQGTIGAIKMIEEETNQRLL